MCCKAMPQLEFAPITPGPDHPLGAQVRDLMMAEFSSYDPSEIQRDNWGEATYSVLDLPNPEGLFKPVSPTQYYVLAREDRLYAAAGVKADSAEVIAKDAWELVTIAVPPHCRAAGYGRELLSRIEDLAREAGAQALVAQITKPGFFAACGYGHVSGRSSSIMQKPFRRL